MDFKDYMKNALQKVKNIWNTGKVQRTSRITYGVFWNIVLFFVIVGFIGFVFIGGIGAGYFASLVKDEQIRDYETMAQDIYNYSETSRMFFANNVYFGEVSADLHRDETTLDDIAPLLIDAVIATEDEYFNEHQGIVPKAILRAVLQEVSSAPVQSGGSTLTQQLIKNQILTNEVSFERKAKEILLALRLERFFEKDEILEAYLNIVPYGRDASGSNIAGIQTAAQGIFGIDADEVNLAQAAYLAGLPQSPSAYTPFASGGGLKSEEGIQAGLNRMMTVLNRMLEMEYITEDQYNTAKNYDIVADFKQEEETSYEQYPILTGEIQLRAEDILFNHFIEMDGYTAQDLRAIPGLREEYRDKAERAIRMNGYEIHTTIDKEIYDAFQEVAKNYQHYGPNTITPIKDGDGNIVDEKEQYVQTGAVMIENSTGKIISFLGSREHSLEDELNYMKAIRSNGSTMKPLLAYGPALEEGLIHPGTPIADVPLIVPDGSGTTEIRNVDRKHQGMLSAREHLAKSRNVPAVKTYMDLIPINPVEKYLTKMGITTVGPNEYANPSLSIGGTTYGVSLEENGNAFATIANYGESVDTYIIDKITTKDGEVIFEHKIEPTRVFSPETSYLLIDMLRDTITQGTGTYLNSQLKYGSVDWAGKTGTSQNTENVHFMGVNPNITFGSWLGYAIPDSLYCGWCDLSHGNRNMKLWAELINAASDINPELVAPQNRFEQPEGIVSRSYCAISGLLPSELCEQAGLVKTGLFNAKFVPTERDNSLTTGAHVRIGNRSVVAGSNTPSEFTNGDGLMFTPEFLIKHGIDKIDDPSLMIPLNGDRSKWENIGIPIGSIEIGEDIDDDGRPPAPPTGVKTSSNQLTWDKSSSNDVIGYRIYEAKEPGGKFSRIGSTDSTSFSINASYGLYYVRSVDYFGVESKESATVTIGDAPKAKEKEDKKEEKEDNNKKNENKNNKDNNSNNGNGNGKDNNNGKGNSNGNEEEDEDEEEENNGED
ncbi:transglycosylase domain-containing protein [Oceanobacillus sp. CAU 1775]